LGVSTFAASFDFFGDIFQIPQYLGEQNWQHQLPFRGVEDQEQVIVQRDLDIRDANEVGLNCYVGHFIVYLATFRAIRVRPHVAEECTLTVDAVVAASPDPSVVSRASE
jgi:hypothetical protein